MTASVSSARRRAPPRGRHACLLGLRLDACAGCARCILAHADTLRRLGARDFSMSSGRMTDLAGCGTWMALPPYCRSNSLGAAKACVHAAGCCEDGFPAAFLNGVGSAAPCRRAVNSAIAGCLDSLCGLLLRSHATRQPGTPTTRDNNIESKTEDTGAVKGLDLSQGEWI